MTKQTAATAIGKQQRSQLGGDVLGTDRLIEVNL